MNELIRKKHGKRWHIGREQAKTSILSRRMKHGLVAGALCSSLTISHTALTTSAAYVSSPSGLNVRAEASTESQIIELLPFGAEVSGVKRGEWVKLANGYVRAKYLQDADPFTEMESLGVWRVTAYAWTGYVCANGEYPEECRTIAHNSLPFGTQIYIEGIGIREVMDRGPSWLGSEWCDLYLGDVWSCVTWGDQQREVWLYAEAE